MYAIRPNQKNKHHMVNVLDVRPNVFLAHCRMSSKGTGVLCCKLGGNSGPWGTQELSQATKSGPRDSTLAPRGPFGCALKATRVTLRLVDYGVHISAHRAFFGAAARAKETCIAGRFLRILFGLVSLGVFFALSVSTTRSPSFVDHLWYSLPSAGGELRAGSKLPKTVLAASRSIFFLHSGSSMVFVRASFNLSVSLMAPEA